MIFEDLLRIYTYTGERPALHNPSVRGTESGLGHMQKTAHKQEMRDFVKLK